MAGVCIGTYVNWGINFHWGRVNLRACDTFDLVSSVWFKVNNNGVDFQNVDILLLLSKSKFDVQFNPKYKKVL